MKTTFLGFFVLLVVSCGTKTPYDSFRKENKEHVEFSMGISKILVHSVINDKDLEQITRHISGISKYHVLISKEKATVFEQKLNLFYTQNHYEPIFKVVENKKEIVFYAYQNQDKLKEILVEIKDNNQLVLLSVSGNLVFKDASALLSYKNEVESN